MSKLTNAVRASFEGSVDSGFPIGIFPQKIQTLLLDLQKYDNFPIEYTALSFLSAIATAIGNTHQINVKGSWNTTPIFYVILVGLPGVSKTHPITFAFAPLQGEDRRYLKEYKAAMKEYREQVAIQKKEKGASTSNEAIEKPVCKRTVLSNVTPEALIRIHDFNKRGVVLKVDEFIGLIKSANQYSRSQFIENLLTAWSGDSLTNDRCNNPEPAIISHPCINIIGTIQPAKLPELMAEDRGENGFIDRCTFVYPSNQEIPLWRMEEPEKEIENYVTPKERWASIMKKIIDLKCQMDEEGEAMTTTLFFSEEAKKHLFHWRNDSIIQLSGAKERSRLMKSTTITVRFSLVFQLMRWACGECSKNEIDLVSVKNAIQLSGYLEKSYAEIQQELTIRAIDPQKKRLLEELPDEFTTSQAIEVGRELGVCERTVKYFLSEQQSKLIEKVKKGIYRKTLPT